jgi:saccharopine dehydrogenase-like NADP-dependent oxidoreductase
MELEHEGHVMKMNFLIFGGSGKIGAAVAWDLVKVNDVSVVGLIGRREDALERKKAWIDSPKIRTHILDVADTRAVKGLMQQYDVGVIALPDRKTSYKVVETAIEAGLNIVDMLEEYHRRPDPYEVEGLETPGGMPVDDYGEWLHKRAMERSVTILDGMGFAPGISNITLGEGIRKLESAESAVARVGGIPSKDAAGKHPLGYMITWAFEHVLREYVVKVKVIKNGEVVEVDAASDLERFRFTQFGQDEALECAITPGMPSFIYTRPDLNEFTEKTVRWPGHWQGIQVLKECGMLDLQPLEISGAKITPREFLLTVIEPKLRPRAGDTDVCVMWNTVVGTKDGRRTRLNYYLWDEADTQNGISAMARVTGFSAAIGALFLGRGAITHKGIVPPEDSIKGELYEAFMDELEKRNIKVIEVPEVID